MALRDAINGNGKTNFRGYGDLSLTELLPALLTRYSETNMMIVAPTLPDQAADIIRKWMQRQWARMDGQGKLDVLAKLTIVADLSERVSPVASAWVKDNPFGDRLVLVDRAQKDTALLLPDIAITGPLNLRYGHNFVCSVTTVSEEVDALWSQYAKLSKAVKRTAKKRQTGVQSRQEPLPDSAGLKEKELSVESPSGFES